jgi:AraC-like DNA-binding protein
VFAVRQYGRWLHENYADLEHKEVWQSLLLLAFILLVFMAYASNGGALGTEYLAQINTLIIITFILWRVETLQQLDAMESSEASEESEESAVASNANNIGALLELHCEATRLYLQHDLTLQQLAIAIGTNRTYLSNYFAQQGITYNAYINRLRIEHFMRLHLTNRNLLQPATAAILAQQSGFHSYTTFSIAFKKHTGTTVTAWMKSESMN